MAEEIDVARPRRRTFYPWDKWTNGATWHAVQGTDFTTSVSNFQTALHQRARLQGLSVITGSPEEGIVEFRFSARQTSEV